MEDIKKNSIGRRTNVTLVCDTLAHENECTKFLRKNDSTHDEVSSRRSDSPHFFIGYTIFDMYIITVSEKLTFLLF